MKIESGYTKPMLNREVSIWYKDQDVGIRDWDDLMNTRTTCELLQKLEPVPFYRYIIRYLVYSHAKELISEAGSEETLIEQIYQEIISAGSKAPLVKRLSGLVMDDFCSNGCGRVKTGKKQNTVRVCGNLDDTRVWDAGRICQLLSAERISDDDLFMLAVGLNMPYEDILLFLQKVQRRSVFNLWNRQEMLLYLTFRYGRGSRIAFLKEVSALYEQAAEARGIQMQETAGTNTIADQMERALRSAEGVFGVPELDRPEMKQFFGAHKYLLNHRGEYTRRAVRLFQEQRKKFEEQCAGDIGIGDDQKKEERKAQKTEEKGKKKGRENENAAKKEDRKEPEDGISFLESRNSEREYAEGFVRVYYKAGTELRIPCGTAFCRKDSKTERESVYVSTEDVTGPAVNEVKIEIPVEFLPEKSQGKNGEQEAHTVFHCERPLKGLGTLENVSRLKADKNSGSVGGKLRGMCAVGRRIPEGTCFTANGCTYVSTKEVCARLFVEVPVKGKVHLEEALKNEIVAVARFDTCENITDLENSKIKLKSRTDVSLGKLCAYLYSPAESSNYIMDEQSLTPKEYAKLLEPVLAGTALSDSRLSKIANAAGKELQVTRTELMTMAFLAVMSEKQFGSVQETGRRRRKTPYGDLAEKLQGVDDILTQCGFYPVYLPNPYDCLLAYLTTCEEPVTAFRNLWGILAAWQQEQKKEAGKAEEGNV